MPTAKLDSTLEMFYEDDDFTEPWLNSEAVLLHHGNFKNARFWYRWVPVLAREFRVIRLDARGMGRSTAPPPGYPYSLSGFADDVRKLLDHLGVDRVHMVGESLGGTIGYQLASETPERLKSLSVCGSPYNFKAINGFTNNRDLVIKDGTRAYAHHTIGVRVTAEANQAEIDWNIEQVAATPNHVGAETLTYLAEQDLTDVLPKIKVPTLLLFGESSPNSPDEILKLIPGSRLERIKDVPGMVCYTAADRSIEAWRRFVASVA